ncbi:allatostatin-A receptor isoform X1 [Cryptotermes secundus]|uniref:allatostatin-A receptor isoform X1 n=1 Tax=Cryptotermes secundus TaxID=105785 RepID=UPI000CD7DEAC|nr:allatostatin-A receptor isoform X1 [Cryptotermes secundus]XP_023710283.1 allatostatin-A receptor isoform X1 [Cryptotermes secundus]XP_023710284.1 allatostatin-A receptor isoform X1 [Cryptotermes secundus]XP_023710285.1 allatostatin-A receptor isoform X1 [Cryptotermes secundus]XP_033607962.1 allatostatin-A receptor isoform X1 [Cryptotermes secundus]XP_033607963.1 allatostatin-A receptor isoform X1 [Cryptotermes secundus]
MGTSETVTSPPPLGVGIGGLRYRACENITANLSEFGAFCSNATESTKSFGLDPAPEQESLVMIQKIVSIVVPILFGLIVLVGLFGNALVVLVVAANQQMRSTTNLLIINLAVADLLFIVFCVPFTATDYVLPFWPFGDVWCKIVQYLIVVTAYASVYTLVLMSLDRFMAVVHPIASMSIRTERNAIAAIAVTWVVILLASVPVYLSHGEITYTYSSTQHTACVFLEADPVNRPEGYNKPAFQIIFFATSYVTPLALICGLYLWLLLRLWRGAAPGGHVSEESRRGKRRVTRMVVVVVAIFAVCWFPIQLILVLKSVDRYEITNTSVMIQIVSHVLAYMNSCVNPILYAFLSDHFRKAFRKVMNCGNAKNTQLGSRYHRGSAVQGQANGRGPNIKSCHEDDNKSALLNVSKTTRLNGNSSRDIF